MSNRTPSWGTSCPAPHLPPLQPGSDELAWHDSARFVRARVVAWTCHEHRVTWYELCQSGGMSFIRRMTTKGAAVVVSYSHAWTYVEGGAVWLALLSGQAR